MRSSSWYPRLGYIIILTNLVWSIWHFDYHMYTSARTILIFLRTWWWWWWWRWWWRWSSWSWSVSVSLSLSSAMWGTALCSEQLHDLHFLGLALRTVPGCCWAHHLHPRLAVDAGERMWHLAARWDCGIRGGGQNQPESIHVVVSENRVSPENCMSMGLWLWYPLFRQMHPMPCLNQVFFSEGPDKNDDNSMALPHAKTFLFEGPEKWW